jgi:hypothetical protein
MVRELEVWLFTDRVGTLSFIIDPMHGLETKSLKQLGMCSS